MSGIDSAIKSKQTSLENLLNALELASGNETPVTLLKRISSLENEIEDLLLDQQTAEKVVVKLNHEQLHSSSQRNATIDLIFLLQALEGEELRDLRVKLSEAIRRSISHIKLYPGGIWNTEQEVLEIATLGVKEDAYELEYALGEVRKHTSTKPNKLERFMTLFFNNGESRTVSRDSLWCG